MVGGELMTGGRLLRPLLLFLQFETEILGVALGHGQLVLEHGVGGAQIGHGGFGLRHLSRGAMQFLVDVVFVLVQLVDLPIGLASQLVQFPVQFPILF